MWNSDSTGNRFASAVNKKAFRPSVKAIKDKYYELFRGKGGGKSAEGAEGPDDMDTGGAGPSSANS